MKQYFWITFAVFLLALSLDGSGQRRDQRREQQRYDSELYISAVSIHGDIDLSGWSPMKNLSGIRPNVGFKTGFKITPALIVSMDLGLNSQAFQHTLRMEYFMIGDGRSTVSGAVYNRRGMINNYRRFYLYAYAGTGGILSKSKIKDLDNGGEEPLSNPGYDNSFQYGYIFPGGVGIKIALFPDWSIGAEFGYQFSTSELLDGFSSESLSNSNDSYYMTSLKAIYNIPTRRNGNPVFSRSYR